ncbi:tetratricopeptide repeat protein [candidate division KSB1 bacterium]|nr:tetratricopeptide repeat protein [candidate division KSB1 bacterium]
MKRIPILFILLLAGCTAINKANKFYDQGDYETAIRESKLILENDSTNVKAYLLLGRSYLAKGELKNAVDALQTAYAITPTSVATKKAKAELINAQAQLSDSLYNAKNYHRAIEGYEYVLELDSTNIHALLKSGDIYYETGQLTKSRDMYQKVLQYNEDNIQAIKKIQAIDNRTAEAEEAYEAGVEYFNDYKYQAALKALEQALQKEPDHYDARYYRALAQGCILYNKGGKDELWDAIEEFGKAMAIRPNAGEPHYYLALAYEKKDRREFENAIREYRNYLEKDPDGEFANQSRKKIKELTELRNRLKEFWGK